MDEHTRMSETATQKSFLLLADNGTKVAYVNSNTLENLQERHKLSLQVGEWLRVNEIADPLESANGVVINLQAGLPNRTEYRLAKKYLNAKQTVWFNWPQEQAVESIDAERLQSYRHHRWYKSLLELFFNLPKQLKQDNTLRKTIGLVIFDVRSLLRFTRRLLYQSVAAKKVLFFRPIYKDLNDFYHHAKPTEFTQNQLNQLSKQEKFAKVRYVRLDFWNKNLRCGGSYTHTCYVAQELAKCCDDFQVLMPSQYELLSEMGLSQHLLHDAGNGIEENIMMSNARYYKELKALLVTDKPDFIYERYCLGMYATAKIAKELQIPYIIEYNGSEVEIKRSFDKQPYRYAYFHSHAELAVLQQATLIIVVSQVIKKQLVAWGIPAKRILVNPNGADANAYQPATKEQKNALKAQFNWNEDNTVIGFVGTFGGWHGIDTLAKALPQICQAKPEARFLLIGDGHHRHLVTEIVEQYNLHEQVAMTGAVPHEEAITLLKTCDMYVAPHSAHMKGCEFFGSPTKLFEYMGLGGGIVASDLMQIGEVLTPSLHVEALTPDTMHKVNDERAILCPPADTQAFVNAVTFLVDQADVREKLGANARQALLNEFTWERNVERIWDFLLHSTQQTKSNLSHKDHSSKLPTEKLEHYKSEVQNQWDNNPCGSQYARETNKYSAQWFKEVEAYRYEVYGPWIRELLSKQDVDGKRVLEVGGGLGTDLAQFAERGAQITDLDLSTGHLNLAKTNFMHRGLTGTFCHGDAENMPLQNDYYDLVYSIGVVHHSPNTQQIINEMWRVLKPGGKALIIVYAENSLHYWQQLFKEQWWLKDNTHRSIADVLSDTVEITDNDARPLVKAYSGKRFKKMFEKFDHIKMHKKHISKQHVPLLLKCLPERYLHKWGGWYLILEATKPDIH